ncbi:MAG: HEAT repeat domain-containing protein [Verrucomicrobiales bacterium]|nr:HEAT repeat domain-containing protein [Verrucomicrobiales bacterium]
MSTNLTMRGIRWAAAIVLVGVVMGVSVVQWQTLEPRYQGKRLGIWLKGHPRDYVPAMEAIGTNALPYLLRELQSRDSGLGRLGIVVFHRWLDSPPPWTTARDRKHRARIGLGVLDTNAVPALLSLAFSKPLRTDDGEPSLEAMFTLAGFRSDGARSMTRRAVVEALDSGDPARQWNACWILALGGANLDTNLLERVASVARSEDPRLRWVAVRATANWGFAQPGPEPLLFERLADEQVAIRLEAISGLRERKACAAEVIAALRRAFDQEPTRPRKADPTRDWLMHGRAESVEEVRWEITRVIHSINPNAELPVAKP